jgi:hypothetical protein
MTFRALATAAALLAITLVPAHSATMTFDGIPAIDKLPAPLLLFLTGLGALALLGRAGKAGAMRRTAF